MMTHEEMRELLPVYALGGLNQAEKSALEEHLSQCPGCQAELSAFQRVTAELDASLPQLRPPERLRASILEAVAPPARQATARRGFSLAWGLAGLAVIVALLLSNLALWGQVRSLQASQPSFQVVQLIGAGSAAQAHGLMVISPDGNFGTLIVDDLPELSADQQYQLWLIKDGQRTSGGVFSVDSWGYGAMVVKSPRPLGEYPSFGITVEPAGGSPGPTGEKVLGGEL